jgi:transposase
MSKALSLDLRHRVVASVRDEGLSHRAAAARFKVSAASISRWRALERRSGDLRPGPLGGDRRSRAIEAHADTILAVFEARRDMTVEELRTELAGQGLRFGYGTLWRFFARHGLTRKKRPRTLPSRIARMC